MGISYDRKKDDGSRMIPLMFCLVCLSFLLGLPDAHRELFAEGQKAPEKEGPTLNVFNISGRAIGAVDVDGNVYNRYGKLIGSVDPEGTIFNVSKIVIGRIDPDGKIFNQSGTHIRTVDVDGNVFSISGTKIGSVNTRGDIIRIGGAARLLFR